MTYVAIFIALILLRYAVAGQARLRDQLYPIVLLLLFLFSAFRFEVGCDWSGYLNQFELQSVNTLAVALQQNEPLWWAIMEGIIRLGLPYPWVNVVASVIFFAGMHALARRQPDPLGFLILLYPILIIDMAMTTLRQGAAIGVLAFAFLAFVDRRLFRFVFFVLLASTLHASAIIFLLLAPLVNGRYSKSRLVLAALMALPGAFFLSQTQSAETGVSRYINTGIEAAGATARVALLAMSGLLFFTLLRNNWERHYPGDFKLLLIGAIVMLALTPLITISTVIADRLSYYFVPIQAIMLARIPYLPIGPSRKVLAASPYLLLLLMFTVWTIFSWHFQICYLPYRSWIFGIPPDGLYSY